MEETLTNHGRDNYQQEEIKEKRSIHKGYFQLHRGKCEKMKASYIVAVFSVLVLFLGYEAQVTMAVACNPSALSSCAGAITSSTPPSKLCCSKLQEQKTCLCQYTKNPKLKKFLASPNAKKVATTCGVAVKC
ncbi:hypothetical protein C3L33_01004, partial [Rhododendron williamsianum]